MATFFTSDLHFAHGAILDYCPWRPWETVEAMDEALVAAWNATVAPGDSVYCLGDFCLGDFRKISHFRSRLNGRVHLVRGNHDRRGKAFFLRAGFATVQDEYQAEALGLVIRLRHEPPSREEEAAFRGDLWLSGHVHGLWRHRGVATNVGVDAWRYCPVTLEEILESRARFFAVPRGLPRGENLRTEENHGRPSQP